MRFYYGTKLEAKLHWRQYENGSHGGRFLLSLPGLSEEFIHQPIHLPESATDFRFGHMIASTDTDPVVKIRRNGVERMIEMTGGIKVQVIPSAYNGTIIIGYTIMTGFIEPLGETVEDMEIPVVLTSELNAKEMESIAYASGRAEMNIPAKIFIAKGSTVFYKQPSSYQRDLDSLTHTSHLLFFGDYKNTKMKVDFSNAHIGPRWPPWSDMRIK